MANGPQLLVYLYIPSLYTCVTYSCQKLYFVFRMLKNFKHCNKLDIHVVCMTLLLISLVHDCLKNCFGVDGTVLVCIDSYPTNCKQKFKLGDTYFEVFLTLFDVTHGCLLGPLLFLFILVSLVISSSNVTHYLCADITQIYLTINSRNFNSSFAELSVCFLIWSGIMV